MEKSILKEDYLVVDCFKRQTKLSCSLYKIDDEEAFSMVIANGRGRNDMHERFFFHHCLKSIYNTTFNMSIFQPALACGFVSFIPQLKHFDHYCIKCGSVILVN